MLFIILSFIATTIIIYVLLVIFLSKFTHRIWTSKFGGLSLILHITGKGNQKKITTWFGSIRTCGELSLFVNSDLFWLFYILGCNRQNKINKKEGREIQRKIRVKVRWKKKRSK